MSQHIKEFQIKIFKIFASFSYHLSKTYFWLRKNLKVWLVALMLTSFILGSFGYQLAYKINSFEASYRALSQFAIQTDWDILKQYTKSLLENEKKLHKNENNTSTNSQSNNKEEALYPDVNTITYVLILSSAICAMLSVFASVVLLFLENYFVFIRTFFIQKFSQNYQIVVGLGANSHHYLNNILDAKTEKISSSPYDIVIIDRNPDPLLLQPLKEAGMGIIVGDASDDKLLKKIHLNNAKQIFISAGNDETNIEIALEILEVLNCVEKTSDIKIIISLTPKGMQHYYTNKGLLDNYKNVDVKAFCYADEAAQELFEKFNIEGEEAEVIDSLDPYAIMVIGSGDLAMQIIYHASIISALPNSNHLIIYCVDDDYGNLEKNIYYLFNGINHIEQITLEFLPEYRISSALKQDIFKKSILKTIIVCDDNQHCNIEVATDLVERVYRHVEYSPKIIVAIYDKPKIAKRIDDNNTLHKNVVPFAEASHICSIKNVHGEDRDNIAKFMAKGYADIFKKDALIQTDSEMHCVNVNWKKSTLSDKVSNLSQAQHIRIKLKAMGLQIDKVNKENKIPAVTIRENREVFDEALNKILNIEVLFEDIEELSKLKKCKEELKNGSQSLCDKDQEKMKQLIDQYFPLEKETLFKKLIDCEHERWNRHHYMNNWQLAPKKNKDLKLHNCLKPFSKFEEDLRETVLYDLYSIVYIPNYCTQVGWRIEKIQPSKISIKSKTIIGVIGHRNIIESTHLIAKVDRVLRCINSEKSKYKAEKYEILSPLADGADMLVAERAINILKAKLTVIVPFELESYKNGIDGQYKGITSKKRFEALYAQAKKNLQECEKITELEWISCENSLDKKTDEQFELLGQTIVKECDILIALYDGKESQGKGGTAEIYEYAKAKNQKVIRIPAKRKV